MATRYLTEFISSTFITRTALTRTHKIEIERETGGESHLCPERCSARSGGCAGTHKQAGNVCVCVKGGGGGLFCAIVVGRVEKVWCNVCFCKLRRFAYSIYECMRACVRARWCVPKSSWLRWCSRWVGCDSPSLPILLLLSDRLWCQIWLVTDSGSCAVVCQHMPVFFVLFFYFLPPSLPDLGVP